MVEEKVEAIGYTRPGVLINEEDEEEGVANVRRAEGRGWRGRGPSGSPIPALPAGLIVVKGRPRERKVGGVGVERGVRRGMRGKAEGG